MTQTMAVAQDYLKLVQELNQFVVQMENALSTLSHRSGEMIGTSKENLLKTLAEWQKRIHLAKKQLDDWPREFGKKPWVLSLKDSLDKCEKAAHSCYRGLKKVDWDSYRQSYQAALLHFREQAASLSQAIQLIDWSPTSSQNESMAGRAQLQWGRKIFHTFNGLLGIWLYNFSGLSHLQVVLVLSFFLSVAVTTEIVRHLSPRLNEKICNLYGPIMRERERTRISSATWYMAAIMVVFLLFPQEVGVLALWYVSVGDTVAGIVGVKWGRHKLNLHSTIEGTLAAFLACFVGNLLFVSLWFPHFHLQGMALVLFSLAAALVGAASEISFKKIDDNLVIPLLSSPFLWILMAIFN